jgi:hypothetical protein
MNVLFPLLVLLLLLLLLRLWLFLFVFLFLFIFYDPSSHFRAMVFSIFFLQILISSLPTSSSVSGASLLHPSKINFQSPLPFCLGYPDIRDSFNLFKGFHFSPACPPDKVGIKRKKNVCLGGMILTGQKSKY